jgi:putative tryptophan/tyrosine transport system substrate-binding protein
MPFDQLKRRELITLVGGAMAAWPLAARAQPAGRVRRIGVLMALLEHDPEVQARIRVFQEGLRQAGWKVDVNARIDYQFNTNDDVARKQALELVGLGPDVILAHASTALLSLQQVTPIIPIVFIQVTDPVGNGFVESLSRPGGNITGFSSFEFSSDRTYLTIAARRARRRRVLPFHVSCSGRITKRGEVVRYILASNHNNRNRAVG